MTKKTILISFLALVLIHGNNGFATDQGNITTRATSVNTNRSDDSTPRNDDLVTLNEVDNIINEVSDNDGAINLIINPLNISTVSDGGWSSSGGGQFTGNRFNPWFIGSEKVKYCINHGGPDRFSLSFAESKKQIAESIKELTQQFQSLSENKSSTRYVSEDQPEECGVFSYLPLIEGIENSDYTIPYEGNDSICRDHLPARVNENPFFKGAQSISYEFVYSDFCDDVDLEFILGNSEDKKVQFLIDYYGRDNFLKHAGIAIRTSYNEELKRGKGFIYIAADKGQKKYAGPQNNSIQKQLIWSLEEIHGEAKVVNDSYLKKRKHLHRFKDLANEKFHDHYMSPFKFVVTHELGHVFGFKHNKHGNLMDEDMPAKVIERGVIEKNDYRLKSKIITNSLPHLSDDYSILYRFKKTRFHKYEINHEWDFLLGKFLDSKNNDWFELKSELFRIDLYDISSKENYIDNSILSIIGIPGVTFGGFNVGYPGHNPRLRSPMKSSGAGVIYLLNIAEDEFKYQQVLDLEATRLVDYESVENKEKFQVNSSKVERVELKASKAKVAQIESGWIYNLVDNEWVESTKVGTTKNYVMTLPILNLWHTNFKFALTNAFSNILVELHHNYYGGESKLRLINKSKPNEYVDLILEQLGIENLKTDQQYTITNKPHPFEISDFRRTGKSLEEAKALSRAVKQKYKKENAEPLF